jgi:hypothetical protein
LSPAFTRLCNGHVEGTIADYSDIGIEKIGKQATADLSLVRCPRDSAVMRLVACRAAPKDDPTARAKAMDRLPKGKDWRVRDLDYECPACRRLALRVRYVPLVRKKPQ